MASMWRRAMVYLGLQDDDELEYGGEYESYGEYGEAADEPPQPRAPGTRDNAGRNGPTRDTGTVRTRPETRADYGADYGAPEPPPPARPAAPREEPSGMSAPRPSVVRTVGPTTAARVHVVEPQGFNDAQEVG